MDCFAEVPKIANIDNKASLASISSTFYARIFCTKVLLYVCQSQNVTRKKLRKALSYAKAAHKTLMKLTPKRTFLQRTK